MPFFDTALPCVGDHETDPAAGLLNAVQQTIGVAALGPVFLGSPAAARTNPPQHYNLRRNPCRETQCAARYDLSSTGNA